MSFATDLAYHKTGATLAETYRRLPMSRIRHVVEYEGLRTKRTFIEFYNEYSEPSPTGLLLSPADIWCVVVGETLIVLPTIRLRNLAFPKWFQRQDWGGDHGAFAGVLLDLTRLASQAVEPCLPADSIERIRLQILNAAPPRRPVTQDCLWPEPGQ